MILVPDEAPEETVHPASPSAEERRSSGAETKWLLR